MSRKKLIIMSALFSLLTALLLGGCGSGNREGASQGGSAMFGGVATVSETLCASCHSSTVDPQTGEPVYGTGTDGYVNSVHQRGYGCQGCHGGGAGHNGVGPLPFPDPSLSAGGQSHCAGCHSDSTVVSTVDTSIAKYVDSRHNIGGLETSQKCNRCHTHQGAVLADISGYTGDKTIMDALVGAPGDIADADAKHIKCDTCHVSHRPENLRTVNGWNPSVTAGSAVQTGNAQYKLCTSCHTYLNPDGTIVASGTAPTAPFEHNTRWYRIIATTHYDNPATSALEGYGVRTTGANPCFDCHGHEYLTNTRQDETPPRPATIWTDWAKSAHAGGLLQVKYDAAATAAAAGNNKKASQVDAVMAASIPSGAWGGHTSTGCNKCHTSTGLVAFLATPYVYPNPSTQPAATGELLTCWGCHSNASNGTLRTLAGTKATTNYTTDLGYTPAGFALQYGKSAFPDVAGSNICITCHDGRDADPGSVTASTTPQGTHYLPAASVMYVKVGFLNLSTGTSGTTAGYLKSLKSDQDGGSITSTHRSLGTPAMVGNHGVTAADTGFLSNGPCVTCHFGGVNHTLQINQTSVTTVCNKCHTTEGGHAITNIADFNTYFIEPQSEAFQNAIKLAVDIFNIRQSTITIAADSNGIYRRYYKYGTTTNAVLADWTTVATALGMDQTKLVGAVSNITMFSKDKGAYAHARTYSRRLLYDSIDYLDDGVLNMSAGATAIATNPAKFGKGATAFTDGTLTTLAPGTTEAMTFLIKWDRSTGAWSTPQRP